MSIPSVTEIAERLMRQPAAPYHELGPRVVAETICAEYGLAVRRDDFGNLLITYATAPKLRPFVLAAHLDHPGFEIIKKLGPRCYAAAFLGGVPKPYFQPGVPLRLLPGSETATLGKALSGEMRFVIETKTALKTTPEFAVWELTDFAVRGGRIHGRACDDLIGCAVILQTLIALKRAKAKAHVIGVLARAEEVGFHGALMVASKKVLPADSLVISLETSRELPPVKQGQGVIIRVGDRSSVFDSTATRFLTEVANEIQAQDKTFLYQRALMSGGSCEGTAYQEYGFTTAAVCVALGNYHNCGAGQKIAAEHVNEADAASMARLLTTAAQAMPRYAQLTGKLKGRLKKLLKEAQARARKERK